MPNDGSAGCRHPVVLPLRRQNIARLAGKVFWDPHRLHLQATAGALGVA